jgi:O-antigen/teichoic acid export membrane protein
MTERARHRAAWRSLLRSFGTLAAGESAARVVGLLAVIVMARRLGPGAFGVAIVGTTLIAWFRLVVDSGTEVVAVRDTSRNPDSFRPTAERLLGLRLALSLPAAALLALAALLVSAEPQDREALLLFAVVLPMIGLNLRFVVLSVSAARSVAIGNIASQLLLATGVVFLLQDRHDLVLVPLLTGAGELVYAVIVLAAVMPRFGLLLPRIDLRAWRDTLVAGFPLAVNGLARTVIYSFDIFLIAAVMARHDVGLYGAAYKPILFCSGVVALMSVAFLSAYSAPSDISQRTMLARRTARTAALVTIPVALALSLGSSLVLSLIYGPDYAGAATALAILAWTIPLLACGAPYGQTLVSAHRQALFMWHNIAGAAANIAGNAAAIPLFGLTGAASVTVASLGLVLVLNYRSAVKLGLAEPLAHTLRPDPAGGEVVLDGSGRDGDQGVTVGEPHSRRAQRPALQPQEK